MCAIWSAGRENSSALLSGLSVVENDVILLAWPPAPPHPASASAMARQPAEKLERFVGRAIRHDDEVLSASRVLTPDAPKRHFSARWKAAPQAAERSLCAFRIRLVRSIFMANSWCPRPGAVVRARTCSWRATAGRQAR